MVNKRIFYGCQGVYMLDTRGRITSVSNPDGFVHGVQTLSLNEQFDITRIPDVGRSMSVLVENQPQNNLSFSRVLTSFEDYYGYKLSSAPSSYTNGFFLKSSNFGHSITGSDSTDIPQFDIKLVYAPDTGSFIPDQTTSADTYIVELKRCLLTGIEYNFSVDGSFTETLNFSNKIIEYTNTSQTTPDYGNLPLDAGTALRRRQHLDITNSQFPIEVQNFVQLGDIISGLEVFGIQNIRVSLDLDYIRNADIGRWNGASDPTKVNLWSTLSLPLNVVSEFTVLARSTQQVDVRNVNDNFTESLIRLIVNNGNSAYNIIDLGSKNKLESLSVQGGDTSGGVVEYIFSYSNSNNDYMFYNTDNISNVVTQSTEKF